LQILKSAYYENIKKKDEVVRLIPENKDYEKNENFKEAWRRMNDRFNYQIRSHEIISPMLGTNKRLYEIAEYLSKKYNKQIGPVRKRIGKLYQKLKKKERKIYLKHYGEKSKPRTREYSKSKKTSIETSNKINVFSNARILIIESKK